MHMPALVKTWLSDKWGWSGGVGFRIWIIYLAKCMIVYSYP
jgi:hypothetical protein